MAVSQKPGKSIPTIVSELWEMVVSYLKQETVDPIKALGRFILWGVAGALLLTFSSMLLLIAGLRAIQTETGDTFTGTWSFAPYLIVLVAAALVAGISASRIGATTKKKRLP